MLPHQWKECSFEPSGTFQGMKTVLQGWKCKSCGKTIDLPLGTNPQQYEGTMCQSAGKDAKSGHHTQVRAMR